MKLRYSREGIYVEALDLWLDPQVSKPAAWVPHAHSDHARFFSALMFGTKVTLDIYRMRWPVNAECPQTLVPVEWGKPWEFRGATLTAFPAGHILGAAQLLIEHEGERVVYTGDIKLRQPLCGLKTELLRCDHLIIESTFGLPVYHFLDGQEAKRRMVNFARECLADGATPAYLGYPLGRGQEVVFALCEAGIPTAVHGAIAKFIPLYEEHGFAFPGWSKYDARDIAGKALVVVPGMRRTLEATGKDVRVAYVSGWAGLDNARMRASAEMLIPYSDHADFEELLEMVAGSGAKQVDVVHGYTEVFAGILKARLGIEACAPREAAARASEEDALSGEERVTE